MEVLGAVAAALLAGVLLTAGPPEDRISVLRYTGVFLALLFPLSFFLPFATAFLRYGARAGEVIPSLREAVVGAAGAVVLRLGVGLLEGLTLVGAKRHLGARPLVVTAGTLLPALVEVILRSNDIYGAASVLSPVGVLDLLLPELMPALLAGAVTSLWATRPGTD